MSGQAGETHTADGDGAPLLKLRSGHSVWELYPQPPSPSFQPEHNFKADIVVIGAGITGAFLAERLTRMGRQVLVIDRHQPQAASTAASTALLQWAIDQPMLELEQRLGFDAAADLYRASLAAVTHIGDLVGEIGHPADGVNFRHRNSLYFSGDTLDGPALRQEHRLHRHAGLPGRFLDAAQLAMEHGFERDAALFAPGSAEANPVALARLLLNTAIRRGARVASPMTIIDYQASSARVSIRSTEGIEIEAKTLVLANGYEMPPFIPATAHKIVSTWAIASEPLPSNVFWPGQSLIWEASDPYLYLRTTADGRIVAGGEDEDITDADERDAQIDQKAAMIRRKIETLLPGIRLDIATAWTGFFGETRDGLPLIGPVPDHPNCYAAFGYGGNGITFSAMAADIISTFITGAQPKLARFLAIDR